MTDCGAMRLERRFAVARADLILYLQTVHCMTDDISRTLKRIDSKQPY